MANGIQEVLNQLSQRGVFAYVLPFLLIFAVVYGILEKSGILGDNKGVNVVIAGSVGFLALQFNTVTTFFEIIFPRFGVGIAILLVLLVLAGVVYNRQDTDKNKLFYIIGIIVAALIIWWTLSSWDFWGTDFFLGYWFQEHFWTVALIIAVILIIVYVISNRQQSSNKGKAPG